MPAAARVVLASAALVILLCGVAPGQEGVFLTEATAPAAVFPDADRFERLEIDDSPAMRALVEARVGALRPSMWEPRWVAFRAFEGDRVAGTAVVVEEIGKHRPITFIVGVEPDLRVADVAVVAYREAYGGEIASGRFLRQYRERDATEPLRARQEIVNIAGATLSVEAASRAVRKAQAIVAALAEQAG